MTPLINRGDVVDADLAEAGLHPVVVVTRQTAIPLRSNVTVVVVTSVVRGHPAEVALGTDEGLDHECVANCDEIHTVGQRYLLRRRGMLGAERLRAVDDALRLALGLEDAFA